MARFLRKYKVSFTKDKGGQNYYERSLSLENLELLLIVCDKIEVRKTNKKFGTLVFVFERKEINTFVSAKKLPYWILKKFAPEKEWK